jgi:hypothetical protein
LHYPYAQDEHWYPKHDHPIFKEEWADMGLIEKERRCLIPHLALLPVTPKLLRWPLEGSIGSSPCAPAREVALVHRNVRLSWRTPPKTAIGFARAVHESALVHTNAVPAERFRAANTPAKV